MLANLSPANTNRPISLSVLFAETMPLKRVKWIALQTESHSPVGWRHNTWKTNRFSISLRIASVSGDWRTTSGVRDVLSGSSIACNMGDFSFSPSSSLLRNLLFLLLLLLFYFLVIFALLLLLLPLFHPTFLHLPLSSSSFSLFLSSSSSSSSSPPLFLLHLFLIFLLYILLLLFLLLFSAHPPSSYP